MKRIYVTEDSPTQALRVKRILSELPDTQVTFFNDGLETYRAVVDSPPDLLEQSTDGKTVEGRQDQVEQK